MQMYCVGDSVVEQWSWERLPSGHSACPKPSCYIKYGLNPSPGLRPAWGSPACLSSLIACTPCTIAILAGPLLFLKLESLFGLRAFAHALAVVRNALPLFMGGSLVITGE